MFTLDKDARLTTPALLAVLDECPDFLDRLAENRLEDKHLFAVVWRSLPDAREAWLKSIGVEDWVAVRMAARALIEQAFATPDGAASVPVVEAEAGEGEGAAAGDSPLSRGASGTS